MVGDDPKCKCELGKVLAVRGNTSLVIPKDFGVARRKTRRHQALFLRAYRQGNTLKNSLRIADIQIRGFERWLKDDVLFAKHYNDTQLSRQVLTAALLEEELIKRAIIGERTPIVNQGRIVTHVMKKSDKLLELALRANLPEKYQPKQRELGIDLSQEEDGTKHIKAYIGFNPEEV